MTNEELAKMLKEIGDRQEAMMKGLRTDIEALRKTVSSRKAEAENTSSVSEKVDGKYIIDDIAYDITTDDYGVYIKRGLLRYITCDWELPDGVKPTTMEAIKFAIHKWFGDATVKK